MDISANWMRSTADQLTRFVARARDDPKVFATICFTGANHQGLHPAAIHREVQDHLSQNHRALIELPRDHGKSTQMCVRLIWELGRRPDLRIKIVCASAALAEERGRFVREAIAANPRVRLVFPDLRPDRPWEIDRFAVRRGNPAMGPSVTCLGTNGRSTGTRADLLVCDDIVDVTALRSRADRERVKSCFRENLVNLLEPDGRLWYLFTPWHIDDLSAELVRSEVYAHFRRAVPADLTPVWEEHWPRERLQKRRREIGEVAFARAYHLKCVPDGETTIRPEWIQRWTEPVRYETVIMAIDPSVGTQPKNDRTGIVILGRTYDGNVHCLDIDARRASAPTFVRDLDAIDRRWKPDVILFESNGAFRALHDLLATHSRYGSKIRPVVQTKEKLLRIRAFAVHVEAGRFRLHGDNKGRVAGLQQSLYDEMTSFPLGEHDDLVDAAAMGTAWLLDKPSPRVW